MQICSSSHNHKYHQPIYVHWSLSWSMSKTVLYIHFSKNPTLTKKTYPITGQYLTYLTYPNSQNDLLKTDFLKFTIPHLQFLQIQQYNLFLLLEILVLSLILIFFFSDHISYISKSCFSHIRDLRRIRNTLDHKTACTIATSLIHSKLDYCNSLYLNISNQQLNRLQLIFNSAARAVTKIQNSITLLLISNHFTGSKLRNAYNTKFFH